MARNDDLLRAVVSAPSDDAPRLVYADWLDEQGDRDRAEFIRVQCDLARLPADDRRRPGLARREKDLLAQYGWAWAEDLWPRVTEWSFHRGFVERVSMSLETSADNIVNVLQKAPIRHLRDVGQFGDLRGVVDALPHLDRLTGLEFWGLYAFKDSLLKKLLASPHLANLRTLILHHDRNGNTADDQMLATAMGSRHRSNLEELAVNVDGMWRGPSRRLLAAIAESPHLRKLRRLNLSNAGDEGNRPQMNAETARLLGRSPNLANLEALDLGQTSFPKGAWDEVLKWPCLPKLQWLRLHYARQVRPPSVMTVAEIAELPTYRRAFEARVANIDWDSQFITPYDGNASWKGLSWDAYKLQHLFAMWPFVERKDFDGLEKAYREDCRKYAGDAAVAAIDGLNFDGYRKALGPALKRAIAEAARRKRATSIVLRIRPDMDWDGTFHVTADEVVEPFQPREEYSYSGPLAEYPAPDFPDAAAVRDQFPATGPLDPGGARHYLLARTVAAVGRCAAAARSPVPVYISLMYAVFRVARGK